MKRILAIFMITSILLLSSCSVGNQVTAYDEYSLYLVSSDVVETSKTWISGYEGNYEMKTEYDFQNGNGEEKELSFFDKNVTGKLDALQKDVGQDYTVQLYDAADEGYMISLHEKTKEIVKISSTANGPAITTSTKSLSSEEDFIAFAKSVAERYISVADYHVSVEYCDPPAPNQATAYRGNRYIFTRQIAGIDNNDQLIVSIMPNGEVREIKRTGIDQLTAFTEVAVDKEKLELLVKESVNSNSIKTDDLRINSCETSYYLINDGGTLCAYVNAVYSLTPVNVEASLESNEPIYQEEKTYSAGIVFVIPLAEIDS